MAYDEDIHELAKRYPEGVLALLGLRPRGPYRAEAVEVKKTERRVDLVFTPTHPRDPRVYLEWQGWRDPEIERRMLEEIVVHCNQVDDRDRVLAVVVYTRPELRDAALPADVGRGRRRVVTFEPIRLVLTEIAPESLLAAGGGALIALPLVGSEERVRSDVVDWLRTVRARSRSEESRASATDLFLRFLAWRLDTMEAGAVRHLVREMEGVVDVSETPLGRYIGEMALEKGLAKGLEQGIAQGIAKGVATERRRTILLVLELRLGAAPAWVAARLEAEHDLERLEALLTGARQVSAESDVVALFGE